MFADADDDRTQVVSRASLGLDEAVTLVPPPPDQGLRFVVVYKFVRCGLALALAAGITAIILTGRVDSFVRIITQLRQHASTGFSSALAGAALKTLVPGRLWLIVAGFSLDAVICAVEGFALRTGRRWGQWLVVVATGVFVPFELVALWRDPHFGRALLLLFNALVAVYLLMHVLREEARLRQSAL